MTIMGTAILILGYLWISHEQRNVISGIQTGHNMDDIIVSLGIISISLVIIISVISIFISRKLKSNIRTFHDFFSHVSPGNRLNPDTLFFKEFRELADAANKMVEEQACVEKNLKKSLDNLSRSQSIARIGNWEWDLLSGDMYWSDSIYRLFGYEPNEIKINFIFYMTRIYQEDRERVTRAIQQATEENKAFNFEYRIIQPNGMVRTHHVIAEVIRDTNEKPIRMLGIEADITELKAAQEENIKLAMAVEQSAEIIVITDAKGIIEYVNPSFETITGFSKKEAVGQTPRILKSGKQTDEYYKKLWETITSGNTWRGRFVNKKKDKTYYQEDVTIFPIRDKAGNITDFVSVKHDITREAEMERQLLHAQKMEAIGTLAGGIAHDFNNILSAIIGYSEIALYDLEPDSSAAESIGQVLAAGNRAKDLVKQILSFSRSSSNNKTPIRIIHVIKESIKLMRATIPSFIEIRQNIIVGDLQILGDPTQIHQLLINLCTNSAHAMEETGGILEITLDSSFIQEESVQEYPALKPGAYVRLTITDMGKGMTPDVLQRIFDPYFTTKEPGKGTGLGLAVVHGVVKNHNGVIRVKSEPGKGTMFDIYFPAVEAEGTLGTGETESIPFARSEEETILLVDDEKMLTDLGRQMLEKLGYRVAIRNSSVEALELFREHPETFDLIITDMTMPYLTGDNLAREIKKIRADIPIILCTGYSEYMTARKAAAAGINYFLIKPLSINQLASSVRIALDGRELREL